MVAEKKRYKAVIANQSYTIIGNETAHHMDLVTKIVNDQLREIKGISPSIDNEQASVLLAINAISDQLKKQSEILKLQKQNRELQQQAIRVSELENRIKRIEAIETEAKRVLEQTGRGNVKITNHMEAQQILNEERKRAIQERSAQE